MDDGIARLGIELFHTAEQGSNVAPSGGFLVWTLLVLLLVVLGFGYGNDVVFLNQNERTDDSEGHLAHLQLRRHRREAAFVEQVHQCSVDYVVLMVAQGNLVVAVSLCISKELLAPIPGTEEAWLLAPVAFGVEARGCHVQGYSPTLAELLEISGVALVGNVLHAHVDGSHREARLEHAAPVRKQIEKQQRVFATRQAYEYLVAVGNEGILFQRFLEPLAHAPHRHSAAFVVHECRLLLWLIHENEIDSCYNAEKCGSMVPVKSLVLEHDICDKGKHHERYALLNHLQLHQRKGSAIVHEAQSVGRNLTTILEESYHPRERYHPYHGPVGRHSRLLKLEMTVPGQCHEDVADYQQQHRINS